MITKEFIDYISGKTGIERKELIEKDFYLHSLLIKLSKDKHFNKNFVFKGGTCLIKCYLGYYRFSEDMDFSWINQKVFLNKSEKSIRKYLSAEITNLMEILEDYAAEIGMFFKKEKGNKRYIEFGASNKFVTFKLWYRSSLTNLDSFIKIQINFVEKFIFMIKKKEINSLITRINKEELEFLFKKEAAIVLLKPLFNVYDIKELAIEKFRAILTRKGIKARDFIDIYKISKEKKIEPSKLEKGIVDKTRFMLRYEKYRENLKNKLGELEPDFRFGEEEYLLLEKHGEDFYGFVKETMVFLKTLVKEILD